MSCSFSIITISYNSEKTIRKTLDSVLIQNHRPLEYVLVDGGSNDSTVDIIKHYLPKFIEKGIKVTFNSEPDNGISDAFNKGIARSTGDVIGIINSDDMLEKDILETISSVFTEDTDVVCGDCTWLDEKNHTQYIRKSKMQLNRLKYDMVLMHPTCFVRKSLYETYGVFDVDLKFCMDKDLMARFYKNGARFKYLPKVIAIMSSGGVSDTFYKKVFDEGVVIAERNGVPHVMARMYREYKIIRIMAIRFLRGMKKEWMHKNV